VVFALFTLTKRIAQQQTTAAARSHRTPSAPLGMNPLCHKPPGKTRKKRPGAKAGHLGAWRKRAQRIDHRKESRAGCCLRCGGWLRRCAETRTRYRKTFPTSTRK